MKGQLGGDFTGMLLILILLMVVAGVGGLVAWKMKLFGLGGDDDSKKTGGSSSQKPKRKPKIKNETQGPPHDAALPPPPVGKNCSPVIKKSVPKCNYGNVITKPWGVVNSVTCPKPYQYKYTITNARGKKKERTFHSPLPLECAVNTQEGHIYTHLPIRISQNIGGKTFWLRTDIDGRFFKTTCFKGNTVNMEYLGEGKLPPNKDSYLMRIIPYDNPDPPRIKTDPNFTKPEVVEYGKKYYLQFASPEQVLSVGAATFSAVRNNKDCNEHRHFSVKKELDLVGGYMSIQKIPIADNNKVATPIMFLDANNPNSNKKTVKIGDDVTIGFAPYDWGPFSKIRSDLIKGGPAKKLSKEKYHRLFSAAQTGVPSQRYIALDDHDKSLYAAVGQNDGDSMNYTWQLHNTPCRDVDTNCTAANSHRDKYHPYSLSTRDASRCNKTLGFCPKPKPISS